MKRNSDANMEAVKANVNAEITAGEEAKAEIQTKAEAEIKAETEIQTKAEVEIKAEAEIKAETESKAETEAKAETETKAEAKAETEAKSEAEPEPKTEVKSRAKEKAEKKAKVKAEKKANKKVKADKKSNRKPETETEAAPKKRTGRPHNRAHQCLRGFLYCLQHAALTVGVLLLLYILAESFVWAEDEMGNNYVYDNFIGEESATDYADTKAYRNLFQESAYEVIALGSFRSTLETDGQFDGKKIIDIVPFLNRGGDLPREYITTQYYLEDLLKWSRSGFKYQDKRILSQEAAALLNEYSEVTVTENGEKFLAARPSAATVSGNALTERAGSRDYLFIAGPEHLEMLEELKDFPNELKAYRENLAMLAAKMLREKTQYLETPRESEAYLIRPEGNAAASAENPEMLLRLLTEPYRTVWGNGIGDYVAYWTEYRDLCANVEAAADELAANYEVYRRRLNFYSADRSNIRYCIRIIEDGKANIYTNMELENAGINAINKFFYEQCESYFDYNPADMKYETNTAVTEEYIRKAIQAFPQAYPENIRIWFGVARGEYSVMDNFMRIRSAYSDYQDCYRQFFIAAMACFLIYLILLAVLTGQAGRAADEQGNRYIRLGWEDRIPTEIMLALAAAVIIGGWLLLLRIYPDINDPEILNHEMFLPFGGTCILLVSILFSFFYYSFARRLKARRIWRDSLVRWLLGLIRRLVTRLAAAVMRLTEYVHQNVPLLMRVMLPLGGVVVLHGILLLIVGRRSTEWGMLCLSVIDLMVGAVIYKSAADRSSIVAGINKISGGDLKYKVEEKRLYGDNLVLAQAVNSIGDSISSAVDISMKDERMKADLITNVSHDIKTPLTSIINYVDLIKRENIDNEKIKTYIEVLDSKSQRLKQLTDDLVEASKISSGNIVLSLERIDLTELVNQTIGEFTEKFAARRLTVNSRIPGHSLMIEADSRRIWRVMENLFNNIYKYAMEGTRIYIDLQEIPTGQVMLTVKNISAQPLNISAEELTERFIRGDVSRSTEGSGLGLSIAKNLTEAQNGRFEITMDGDLFKVTLIFPMLAQV